jgi:SchA/CurD like domain
MTFAAISYRIKPHCVTEVAEIFSPNSFKRASSPIMRDERGRELGRIVGTALFVDGDTMVRLIQYEGRLTDVARHMARQEGVREAERRIAPYLAVARDTSTVQGFLDYFHASTMRCLTHRVVRDRPLARVIALRDTVDRANAEKLARGIETGRFWMGPERFPAGAKGLLASAAFLRGDTLVRVLQHDGELDVFLRHLAHHGGVSQEQALAPYLSRPRAVATPHDLVACYSNTTMRCISLLSVASLLARP